MIVFQRGNSKNGFDNSRPNTRSRISSHRHRRSNPESMLTVHSPRNYWASIPADPSNDSERWRVRELIAYLIEFHRREHRPMWWNLFNRLEMTEEELFDDKDCLAGLIRTSRQPEPLKRSLLFEYS